MCFYISNDFCYIFIIVIPSGYYLISYLILIILFNLVFRDFKQIKLFYSTNYITIIIIFFLISFHL